MDTLERKRVLYISYDGLTDALGQSQILSYLTRQSKQFEIFIISFEKKENYEKQGQGVQKQLDACGIHWIKKWHTKKPPVLSTLYDVRVAIKTAKKLHAMYHFHLVHCRGYIPALIGEYLKKQYSVPFIFDMRGWWPDEKKESGSWAHPLFNAVYKFFKKKERGFFRNADYVVSLTEAGKKEIIQKFNIPDSKVGLVPTCVNFEVFKAPDHEKRQAMRRRLNIKEDATVLVYSGALGGNYDLSILIGVFKAFNRQFPNSFILVLSKDKPSEQFHSQLEQASITNFSLFNVSYKEVSDYLVAADVGLIFYKPAFSNIGRNPTKLGEYWASGIPVIATRGIGDLDNLQLRYSNALMLVDPDLKDIDYRLSDLKFAERSELRAFAMDYCSLNKGVLFYNNLYSQLINN